LIPQSTGTSEAQTFDERAQLASTQPISATLFQVLHAVVDNDTNKLFGLAATLQLLEVRSGSERCGPRRAVAACVFGFDNRVVGKRCGVFVQSHCGEDGGHVVVVREVGVQLAAERERDVAVVESAVCGSVVVDRLACQASDELVGESYTLAWAERIPMGIAVVLVKSLPVVRNVRAGSGWMILPRNSCTGAIPLR